MFKTRTPKAAAEDFTFGIEIECGLPYEAVTDNGLTPGGYHRGLPQEAFRRAGLGGWVIQRDASVTFRGLTPMEVTSPIMSGVDGVEQTIKMVNLLKSWGAKVNASTGLHVTVGHSKFRNPSVIAQLILSMYRFSDAMVATGASFGRRNRRYSKSLAVKYGTNVERGNDDAAFIARFEGDRYQALNIQNWRAGRVEFRLYAGTLNTNRMLAAIFTAIGTCQYAMSASKLTKAITVGASSYADKAYYNGTVTYLFTKLGWKADKNGNAMWGATKLGVMVPAGFPENTFEKVTKQIRTDAKRMDVENSRVGYTARAPRPVRAARSRRETVTSSPSSEGE